MHNKQYVGCIQNEEDAKSVYSINNTKKTNAELY